MENFAGMCTSLGCGALSAQCTAGTVSLGVALFFLGITLDSAETPSAKITFSWFPKHWNS